jgi:hypothetical protein
MEPRKEMRLRLAQGEDMEGIEEQEEKRWINRKYVLCRVFWCSILTVIYIWRGEKGKLVA